LRGRFPALAQKLSPDWFLNLGLTSDTLLELRRLPTPVGPQTSQRPGSVDTFGPPVPVVDLGLPTVAT